MKEKTTAYPFEKSREKEVTLGSWCLTPNRALGHPECHVQENVKTKNFGDFLFLFYKKTYSTNTREIRPLKKEGS